MAPLPEAAWPVSFAAGVDAYEQGNRDGRKRNGGISGGQTQVGLSVVMSETLRAMACSGRSS